MDSFNVNNVFIDNGYICISSIKIGKRTIICYPLYFNNMFHQKCVHITYNDCFQYNLNNEINDACQYYHNDDIYKFVIYKLIEAITYNSYECYKYKDNNKILDKFNNKLALQLYTFHDIVSMNVINYSCDIEEIINYILYISVKVINDKLDDKDNNILNYVKIIIISIIKTIYKAIVNINDVNIISNIDDNYKDDGYHKIINDI